MRYLMAHGRRIAVETLDTGASRQHKKKVEPFVKVPLWWAMEAAKATRTPKALIWVHLLHTAWKAKSATFRLSNNQLDKLKVSRFTKARALRELEAAGLITIERRRGRSPVVTLVCL